MQNLETRVWKCLEKSSFTTEHSYVSMGDKESLKFIYVDKDDVKKLIKIIVREYERS